MPDTPSIVIVKKFTYRNAAEEYSNRYHFSGTTPADTAAWKALADAIITAERGCYMASTSFIKAYGYVAGNENSVAQIDYAIAPNVIVSGNGTGFTGLTCPGDVAATIRWYTGASSSRGKKIYCRKYMHDVVQEAGQPDKLHATQKTALQTFAAKMIDGTLPGAARYCGPQGASLSAPLVDQWLTTRTLKRRGKRPPT